MKTTITKSEFRMKQSIEYGKCPFIGIGNEEQVNFHAGTIETRLRRKYNVIPDPKQTPESFTNKCYICEAVKTNCNDLLCLDCDKDPNNN
jgi:hypothetical protein